MPTCSVPFREFFVDVFHDLAYAPSADLLSRADVRLLIQPEDALWSVCADAHGYAVGIWRAGDDRRLRPTVLDLVVSRDDQQTVRGQLRTTPTPCSPLTNLQAALVVAMSESACA